MFEYRIWQTSVVYIRGLSKHHCVFEWFMGDCASKCGAGEGGGGGGEGGGGGLNFDF